MKPRRRRALVAVAPVALAAAWIAAAGAHVGGECAATRPTNLDYMVLASMADSAQLLGMAGYRPMGSVGPAGKFSAEGWEQSASPAEQPRTMQAPADARD